MYMTAEEQKDMMDLIKECKKLFEEKNEIIEQVILTARAIAAENAELRIENEKLKRHLSIAEGAIERYRKQEEVRKQVAELNEAGSRWPDDHRAHFNQGWNT